jgi:hypothetical protein
VSIGNLRRIFCSLELDAFQFAEYVSDEDVHLGSQGDPIFIVRDPNGAVLEFSVWGQPAFRKIDSLDLEVQFDDLAEFVSDPYLLVSRDRGLDKKRGVARKSHDANFLTVV